MQAGNIQERRSLEVKAIMGHLSHAREGMRRLMVLSGDWTAKVEIEDDFDGIEQSCRRFALHQLGMVPVDHAQG
jgi:hypothetical protein